MISNELNSYLNYVSLTLPLANDCITELLKSLPSFKGVDLNSDSADRINLTSLLPEYILRFSEDSLVTTNQHLGPAEIYRRRLLNELKYKLILNVNGQPVTHSEPVELRHPLLMADFNQFFELRLIHEPSELSVDVHAVSVRALACLTRGKDFFLLQNIFILVDIFLLISALKTFLDF